MRQTSRSLLALALTLASLACAPAVYVAPAPVFAVGEGQAIAIARQFARSQGLFPGAVRRVFPVAGSWRVELNLIPPTCGEEWVRVNGYNGAVIEAHPRTWPCGVAVAPPLAPVAPLVPQGEAVQIARRYVMAQGYQPGWPRRVYATAEVWHVELPLLQPTCGDEWVAVGMRGGRVLQGQPRIYGCFARPPPPLAPPPEAHPVEPVGPPPGNGNPPPQTYGPPPGNQTYGPPPGGGHAVVPVQ
ncbi:MAG: hypothetical protein ACYCWW_13630 [Deltaproteobacteria bacterium]